MKYWVFIITLLCTSLVQAKMYQWVDDKGRTHFSDKPPAALLEKQKPPVAKTPARIPKKSSSHYGGKNANQYSEGSRKKPSSKPESRSASNSVSKPLLISRMRELLQQKQYQELNSILALAQGSAITDVSTEENLVDLYQSFGLTTKAFGQSLNEWVNAYPASYQPFLARAYYYQTMGWDVRGTKWGSETSDEQKNTMESYFSKARADIKKALNRNAASLMAYVLLIQDTYATSDFKALEGAYEKGLKISPASYELRRRYIRRLRPRWGGSLEKMLAVVVKSEASIDKNPELINIASWIIEEIAESQYNNGNYTLARETLADGLSKIKSASAKSGYTRVQADHYIFYKQGRVEMQLDDYKAALNYFNLALEGNENRADYYYERSKAQERLKNYATSTRDLMIALGINPTTKKYQTFKKRLIHNLNVESYNAKHNVKYTKALRFVNLAIQLDPYNIKSLRRRSYVYVAKRQIAQAKQDMDKAIDVDPSDYDSYKGMDDVLLMQRRFKEIAEYWSKYIALKPNDSRAFFERAGTHYHMKRIDLAVKDAQHAVKLGHPNAAEELRYYKAVLIGAAPQR
jgi:tetratricopeptide (TPR) repeat protein